MLMCTFVLLSENEFTLNQNIMENNTELKENWNARKEELKQKLTKLTNSDELLVDDKQDELLGRLELKLGKPREEIRKIIEAI